MHPFFLCPEDYVEEAWPIVDPVLKADTPVYEYEPNTWGTSEVDQNAVLFRLFLSRKLVKQAKEQADKGIKGAMEGHAEMDMSVEGQSFWQRISSPEAITATSHYFVMDWAMVWKDIAGGLLIAGAVSAWVPQNFWKTLFLTSPLSRQPFGDRLSDRLSRCCRSFVRSATFRWLQCFGMAASALAA